MPDTTGTAGFAEIVVGLQYGDEGKARVVDEQAAKADLIVRFNGGANAGHTVEYNGLRIALKQVPSGVFYPGKMLYIGSGCMVNLKKLFDELNDLKKAGLDVIDRLTISCQAGVIQPHHLVLDGLIGGTIGTTKNGIGPAYADRAMRMWGDRMLNIRMGDLVDNPTESFAMMRKNFEEAVKMYQISAGTIDIAAEIETLKKMVAVIGPRVAMDPLFVYNKVIGGAKVVFEGAQSCMLDVNKGTVPFVTSSATVASAAYVGGDLPAKFHKKTIGIAKMIMSRVGHGPFPSEFGGARSEEYCMAYNATDGSPTYGKAVEAQYDLNQLLQSEDDFDIGKAVRSLSGEYGTVTTRPRRIGAFDLVQLAYAVKANGVDEIVLTKCDLLNVYSRTKKGQIPLVTGYTLDGVPINHVPGTTAAYYRVKPIVEYRPGFTEDISGIRKFADLPQALKNLVAEIEQKAGCRVKGLGVGPEREQYVEQE